MYSYNIILAHSYNNDKTLFTVAYIHVHVWFKETHTDFFF